VRVGRRVVFKKKRAGNLLGTISPGEFLKNKIMGTILSITEKIHTTLLDGLYGGTCDGNIITIMYKDKTYECETNIGCNVVVTIKDGVATFQEIKN